MHIYPHYSEKTLFFFLSKNVSTFLGEVLMQLSVISFFTPWVVYLFSKRWRNNTITSATSDGTP